ncbi:STAS domain-containing protein [Georgenia sp. SYP-B2076]|uniref:STAS domain-containing protein n=1 Tax=Georgenia sp. SYP-B2076 TaxID=2495881 RepID=UPI000F8DBAE7|nr:STAS domain-containing protein [Georgenia sp. SYP-B2076]
MADSTVEAPPREEYAGDEGSVALLTSPSRNRLILAGELDVSMNEELTEAAREIERSGLPVDVDVRNLVFMDSSVIAVLARVAYRLPDRMQIIEPPDVVRFLLEVTNIGEIVDIVEKDPGFPIAPAAAVPEPPNVA